MFAIQRRKPAKNITNTASHRPGSTQTETHDRLSSNPLWSRLTSRIAPSAINRPLIQTKLTVGSANDPYEQEANRVADQVVRMSDPGQGQHVKRDHTSPTIQRMCAKCEEELQRQPEDEELVQTKPLASQITPLIQRQAEEEDELVQSKSTTNSTPSVSDRTGSSGSKPTSNRGLLFLSL